MTLEESIKQTKPFKDEYEKLGVNLLFTTNWLVTQLKDHFKRFEVTPKQYNILRILRGAQKPVSTSFIRERLLDKMSDVSRIVDRLEKRDLVKKSVCKNDKRLVDVQLTDSGKEKVLLINKEMKVMRTIFSELNTKEVKTLNTLLDNIRTNN